MKSFLVVEGNIGAGKSTFLKLIHDHLTIERIAEPVDSWQLIGTDNLLQKFYDDPKRWGYTFQTFAFVSRAVKQQKQVHASNASLFLQERSVFSDRFCFAKNCFEMGNLTALEWKLYQEWFGWLVHSLPRPTVFIYLQTNPEICYERIKKRNRGEEKTITLDYLTRLHDLHEAWLVRQKGVPDWIAAIPVLTIPVYDDFEHNTLNQQHIVKQVKDLITSKNFSSSSNNVLEHF